MTRAFHNASRGWRQAVLAAVSLACVCAAPQFGFTSAASAQTPLPPPGATTAADLEQNRVESLERQLREATAENERLQFQLRQAQREIARLQQVTGDLAAANTNLQTPTAPPPAPAAPTPRPQAPAPEQRSSLGTLSVPPGSQAPGASAQAP